MLLEPGEAEDHALLAQPGDHKEDAFQVSLVGHDHIYDFV